jgi:hypothetical protein
MWRSRTNGTGPATFIRYLGMEFAVVVEGNGGTNDKYTFLSIACFAWGCYFLVV